jgi:Tfp pilus assembly protein PilO
MKNIQKFIADYQSLVMPILLLILISFSWRFLVPRFNQARALYEGIQKDKQKIASLEAKVSELKSLNEFELSEKSEVLLSAIPSEKNVVGVMISIEKTAEENGVQIGSISVSPGEIATQSAKKVTLEEMGFEMKIKGDIEKFIAYLKAVSETLPLMNVQNIKISLVDNRQANVGCVLKGYFAGLPVSLGRIDAPVAKLSSKDETLLGQIRQFRLYETEIFEPIPGGKTNPFTY